MARLRHGQNKDWTKFKEGLFATCLRWHIKVGPFRNGVHPGVYIHVDTNAGSGRNVIANCKGTPMVFIDAALEYQFHSRARFIDNDQNAIQSLQAVVDAKLSPNLLGCKPCVSAQCVAMDNRQALLKLPGHVTKVCGNKSSGSILCDPNGIAPGRGGFPLTELGVAAAALPHWLILLHWNYGAACRTGGYAANHPSRPMTSLTLTQVFATIQRTHWLIAKSSGRAQTVVCGSNYYIPPKEDRGLYTLNSVTGQQLFQQYNGIPRKVRP